MSVKQQRMNTIAIVISLSFVVLFLALIYAAVLGDVVVFRNKYIIAFIAAIFVMLLGTLSVMLPTKKKKR